MFSEVTLKYDSKGLPIVAANEPLIENTISTAITSQLVFKPQRCFNFSMDAKVIKRKRANKCLPFLILYKYDILFFTKHTT